MEIEVLIVDDHGLVREGLRALLDAEEGVRVVGEARRADEALALAAKLRPGVVVLDIGLPDRGGLEIVGEIRDASPASRILMCSGLAEGSMLVAAAAAGADGFVAKESPNAEIVDAVRRVADGAAVVGQESAELMFRDLREQRSNVAKLEALSEREREVLSLLAEGLTNREILAPDVHRREDGPQPRLERPPQALAPASDRGGTVRGAAEGASAPPLLRPGQMSRDAGPSRPIVRRPVMPETVRGTRSDPRFRRKERWSLPCGLATSPSQGTRTCGGSLPMIDRATAVPTRPSRVGIAMSGRVKP